MNTDLGGSSQLPKTNLTDGSTLDYLAAVIRGKWIILGLLASFLLAAFVYTKSSAPVYKATTAVLVNTKFATTPTPLFLDPRSENFMVNPIQNEMEILKSHTLVDTVAQELLQYDSGGEAGESLLPVLRPSKSDTSQRRTAPLEVVAGRVASAITFEAVREANVIRITAKSEDPQEAALMANTYAKAYYDRDLSMSRSKSHVLRKSLETQVREKRLALAAAEDSLKRYQEQHGVVSLDDETRTVIAQLSQLQASRDAVGVDLRTLATNISAYREQIAQQEKSVATAMESANDPYLLQIQEQLAKLEVQRDMTVAQNPSMTGDELYSSTLKDIDNQIASLRSKLKSRTDQFLKNIIPAQEGGSQSEPVGYLRQIKQKMLASEIEIQSLVTKRDALDAAIRQYELRFNRIPGTSLRFAKLQREQQSIEKLYVLIEEKYNQASLVEESQFGFIDIIDPAVVPNSPSSPKLPLNMAAGGTLGLVLGLMIVFVREYLDPRIQSPEDLKKRGFVVLSTVARMNKELRLLSDHNEQSGKPGIRRAYVIALRSPFSPVTESYRLLRTNLEHTRQVTPMRTLLVTSCIQGEGKSTTIANLATVLAQAGKKVLLIDADLRNPTVHESFNTKLKPGLSELLTDAARYDDAVVKTAVKNLYLVTAGSFPSNPADLLGSARMKEYLERFKLEFDLVLFDSPPVLAVTDACVLSMITDGVLVVLSAGQTRISQLEETIDLVQRVHGRMPAIVLNNFDIHRAYGFTYGRSGYGHYRYSEAYHRDRPNGKGTRKVLDGTS